jgi:RTX calcium-binding nonapeptide repeat (4 copies)
MRAAALTLGVLACGALTAPAAAAQGGSRQDATLTFTTPNPGALSGQALTIDYVNPADPQAKPPAVRRVVTELAPGASYDTGVPDLCTAPDPELIALGPAACPPGSVVGGGVVTTDSGVPGPGRFVTTDTTFLNNSDELILVNTERGSGAHVVTRAQVGDRTRVTELPPLPGTPPDGGAIDTVEFTDFPVSREVGGVVRNFITTPQDCPEETRFWVNRIHFTYFDGVTQVVETRSACDPAGAAGPPSCRGRPATMVASPASRTVGTPGDDVIAGTPGNDVVATGGGDDLLCGRGGVDKLESGDGDDEVSGGSGNDRLAAGPGADRLRGGPGRDRCAGGPGADSERRC